MLDILEQVDRAIWGDAGKRASWLFTALAIGVIFIDLAWHAWSGH